MAHSQPDATGTPTLESPPVTPEVSVPAPVEAEASSSERDELRPKKTIEELLPNTGDAPDIDPRVLDVDAVRVLLRLRNHGHEAYLVGGCVRDALLGIKPKDFDIATSAKPEEVKRLFKNCRLVGRRFRLAHVYFRGGKVLEVSTFRKNPTEVEEAAAEDLVLAADPVAPLAPVQAELLDEGADTADETQDGGDDAGDDEGDDADVNDAGDDGEGDAEEAFVTAPNPIPASVAAPAPVVTRAAESAAAPHKDVFIKEDNTFGTAVEDAVRRDFTINGLFYDPVKGQVLDYVNGLKDLAAGEIRTIGDPEVRLREDPVRLLRAVRFQCKLDFQFEPRTLAAMEGAVEDLSRCSAPRLLEETFRLIRGGHAAPALKLLIALDALKILLPPLDADIRNGGDEERTRFFRLAESLDELVADGALFDDSMLLAALLLPLAFMTQPQGPTHGQPVVAQLAEGLLSTLVQTARLPRRIAERCRMLLLSQRTYAGLRRRRGGLGGFRGHPLFGEGLKVFEVWVRATGQFEAELAAWKEGAAPAVSPNAPSDHGGSKRRRRSRGGRNRGRSGGGGGGGDSSRGPPPSGGSNA